MSVHSSNHNRPGGPLNDDDDTNPLQDGTNASAYHTADEHAPDFDLNSMRSQGSNYAGAQGQPGQDINNNVDGVPKQPQQAGRPTSEIPEELLAFNQRYAEHEGAAPVHSQMPLAPYRGDSVASAAALAALAAPNTGAGGAGSGGYNRPQLGGGGKAARRRQREANRQALLNDLREKLEHKLREKEQRQALRTIEYEERLEKHRQHRFPTPGTIGLCGAGMATTFLSYSNTGYFEVSSSIPAFDLTFCAFAETVAGIFEWINGVSFAHAAVLTYGAFHMSVALMVIIPADAILSDNKNSFYYEGRIANPNGFAPTSGYFLGTYQVLLTIHTFALLCCTPNMNLALFVPVFGVFLTFLFGAISGMINNTPLLHASGWCGTISGGFIVYLAVSETVNTVWGRTILPVFPFREMGPSYRNYLNRKAARKQKAEEV